MGIELFYLELGRRVQLLRVRRGMTQAQLAYLLVPRVTRASIANLETGKQRVLAHTLVQLAKVLRVPLQVLVPDLESGVNSLVRRHGLARELAKALVLPQRHVKKLVGQPRRHETKGRPV